MQLKDTACHNEDQRSQVLQLTPSVAKVKKKKIPFGKRGKDLRSLKKPSLMAMSYSVGYQE